MALLELIQQIPKCGLNSVISPLDKMILPLFFTSDENIIEATKSEGLIIRITGNTLGQPNGTPYVKLLLIYYLFD